MAISILDKDYLQRITGTGTLIHGTGDGRCLLSHMKAKGMHNTTKHENVIALCI